MATTELKRCTCSKTPAADYQDKIYGKGMRVVNQNQKKEWVCTICGSKVK